jgi:hypothetical protein
MALSSKFRFSAGMTGFPSDGVPGDGIGAVGSVEIGGETSTVREHPMMKQNRIGSQIVMFRMFRSQSRISKVCSGTRLEILASERVLFAVLGAKDGHLV